MGTVVVLNSCCTEDLPPTLLQLECGKGSVPIIKSLGAVPTFKSKVCTLFIGLEFWTGSQVC